MPPLPESSVQGRARNDTLCKTENSIVHIYEWEGVGLAGDGESQMRPVTPASPLLDSTTSFLRLRASDTPPSKNILFTALPSDLFFPFKLNFGSSLNYDFDQKILWVQTLWFSDALTLGSSFPHT